MKTILAIAWIAVLQMQVSAQNIQATYGYSYSAASRHANSGSPSFSLPGSLTLQAFPWWNIKLEATTLKAIPVVSQPWADGVGDTFLGSTLSIPEKLGGRPGLSFNYRIKFPTAENGFGTGKHDHRLLFGLTKTLDSKWSLQVGAGNNVSGRTAASGYDQRGIFTTAITRTFIPTSVKFAAELDLAPSVINSFVHKGTDTYVVSTVSFPLFNKFSFRGTATTGITPYTPAAGVGASVIYDLKLK